MEIHLLLYVCVAGWHSLDGPGSSSFYLNPPLPPLSLFLVMLKGYAGMANPWLVLAGAHGVCQVCGLACAVMLPICVACSSRFLHVCCRTSTPTNQLGKCSIVL